MRQKELYNASFTISPENVLEIVTHEDKTQPANITYDLLFDYPGIELTIALPSFVFTRRIEANFKRDLVLGHDRTFATLEEKNVEQTRFKNCVFSSKLNSEISTILISKYLGEIENVMSNTVSLSTRKNIIKHVFDMINNDLKNDTTVYRKMNHSRLLNSYEYYRDFDNDTIENNENIHFHSAVLRETINPELLFTIERCSFTNDNLVDEKNSNDFLEFFRNICIHKTTETEFAFVDTLKKCLKIKCTFCNVEFEGAICISVAIDHYQKHHLNSTEFKCTNCYEKFSQNKLVKCNWKHECTK